MLSSRQLKISVKSLFVLLIILATSYNSSKFGPHIPSHRHLSDDKKKPVLYTFVDNENMENFDSHSRDLLDVWKLYWNKAGWDTKILTPATAKLHFDYDEFSERLDKAGIFGLARQSYIRHLAMSAVKSGGFFSEYFIFPLQKAIVNENNNFLSLPYSGKWTSYDESFSLISASHSQWNLISKLLMENMGKNDFVSLKKILYQNPDAYNHHNLVNSPFDILSKKQFTLDICGSFSKEKVGVRFHQAEIKDLHYTLTERVDLVSSWMRLYEARCQSNRPLIFTFVEGIDDLVEVWKEAWSNAGFAPIVLSLQDVKRHPKYKYFLSILDRDHFQDGIDKINYFCLLRWIAMSVSGGGWLADYDIFPINIKPSLTLPNDGNFTGHSGLLPALLSGSAAEWNRMSKLIFTIYERKIAQKISFWSDFLSMKEIKSIDNFSFAVKQETIDLYDFYVNDISTLRPLVSGKRVVQVFDLKDKCYLSNDISVLAIHFLHYKFEAFYFRESNLNRSEFIKKWHQTWLQQCKK